MGLAKLSDPEQIWKKTVEVLEDRAARLSWMFSGAEYNAIAILLDDIVAFYELFDGLYVAFCTYFSSLALVIELVRASETEYYHLIVPAYGSHTATSV